MLAPKRIARLLSPLALLALCAESSPAPSPPPPARYADRLKEFEARAAEQRKALGLSQAEIDARFPQPQIFLTGLEALPVIRPGQTGRVHAAFNPPLAEGALVAFDCDDAVVSDLELNSARLHATIAVPLLHPAGICSLAVHQPVSLRSATVPAFRVDGAYAWSLSLSNGMAVRWTMRLDQFGERGIASTWRLGGGAEEQRDLLVDREGVSGGHFTARVDRNDQDDERSAALHDSPEDRLKAYEAEGAALSAKVAACEGLPADKLLACVDQYTPQIQALLARRPSSDPKAKVRWVHPTLCDELTLDVAEGGKITGTAQGCAGDRDATVTGTLTATAP